MKSLKFIALSTAIIASPAFAAETVTVETTSGVVTLYPITPKAPAGTLTKPETAATGSADINAKENTPTNAVKTDSGSVGTVLTAPSVPAVATPTTSSSTSSSWATSPDGTTVETETTTTRTVVPSPAPQAVQPAVITPDPYKSGTAGTIGSPGKSASQNSETLPASR